MASVIVLVQTIHFLTTLQKFKPICSVTRHSLKLHNNKIVVQSSMQQCDTDSKWHLLLFLSRPTHFWTTLQKFRKHFPKVIYGWYTMFVLDVLSLHNINVFLVSNILVYYNILWALRGQQLNTLFDITQESSG